MQRTTFGLVFSAIFSLATYASDLPREIRYEVIPMGSAPEPGGYISPFGLNNRGELIGQQFGSAQAMFLWDCAHGRTEIPPPFATGINNQLIALNDAGQVIGNTERLPNTDWVHAFIWTREKGSRLLVETPLNSAVTVGDINESGIVLAQQIFFVPGMPITTFLWTERFGRSDLPNQDVLYQLITNGGQLVALSVGEYRSALLINPRGGARVLVTPPPGGSVDSTIDINDRNDVVGGLRIDGSGFGYLALSNGELELFPEFGPSALNNRRQVVGAISKEPDVAAAIWDRRSGLRDLNDLVHSDNDDFDDIDFQWTVAINERGWIAVQGIHRATQTTHAYLLVPVPAKARDLNLHTLQGEALCRALRRIG